MPERAPKAASNEADITSRAGPVVELGRHGTPVSAPRYTIRAGTRCHGGMPFIPMAISRLPRWHRGDRALQQRKRCVGSRTAFTLEGTEDEVTRVATGDVTSGACLVTRGLGYEGGVRGCICRRCRRSLTVLQLPCVRSRYTLYTAGRHGPGCRMACGNCPKREQQKLRLTTTTSTTTTSTSRQGYKRLNARWCPPMSHN
jgi:hypothetical protein